ncbi:MAG: hypothetical protein ABEI98_08705 [Halorhabdus sp.]
MAETSERYCPRCETTRPFERVARTRMALGTKVKWHCRECGFTVVNIDPELAVETTA